MNLNSLGLVGLLMKTSPTTGIALRSLVDFLHIHSQGAVTTLTEDDELAILTYDALEADLQASDQTGAGAVAMMLNAMRALCGQEFRPVEVSFAHRQPADIEPFRKFFRVPMYFDAEHFALVFSRNWLDTRPVGADKEIQRLLRKQIDAIKVKHSLEFPEQVRNVLRSALITGHATEKQIAALFSMTPRTLIRRMDEFDTSFHEVIDGCRFEIARQMLKNTTLNVSQISTSLGYSRSSAFIRAFRRWTGSTPAQWRDKSVDGNTVT